MARSVIVKRVGLTFLLLAGAVGCKASVNAEAKAGSSGSSASADGDASLDASAEAEAGGQGLDKPVATGTAPTDEAFALAASGPALLGARRDLKFKGPKHVTCSCLAVALGEPEDAAFEWEHVPPSINSQQIVVALSSEGVSCGGDVGLGASYKGYQTPGNDVVIMVERAHQGRPVTSGAVIPRPIADGQVYVVAAEKGSPFGGTVANPNERCKLGLPRAVAGPTPAVAASSSASGAASESESESEIVLEEAPADEASEFVDNVDESASGEDKAPEAPETRDGFFLALHPSGSYVILLDRDTDTKIQGFGFGLDVLVGGAVSEGLSLGVILGGAAYPSPESEVEGSDVEFASNVDLNLFHIAAFVDYYTDPDSGLHLLGELGYGQLETTGSDVESQTIQGVLVAGGVGYDWWVSDSWSLGLLGRFSFGATQQTQSDTQQWLLLPALNFTATYH